ncbi:glycosyltransferase [Arhodomonas sp. KWT2]|uniref:glycosyltransferase n=1 Tax=Arhodomonas sp. KWT2 TaxID=3344194 RepID=UPI0035BF8FCE
MSAVPVTAARPRVAVVTDAGAGRNGVGTYYQDLSDALAPHLDTITTIGPDTGNGLREWLSVPLPGDRSQRVGVPDPRALARRLAEIAPETVVIATPGPYGLLGARAARRLGARVVFGMHTHYAALGRLYWGALRGTAGRLGLRACNRHLLRRADAVMAVSEGMRTLAAADGAPAVRVTGTPLGPPFLNRPVRPASGRLEAVLFVGRLAAEKSLPEVLAAARALPGIRFSIAGEGPLRTRVEADAAALPNLDYLGWLPREAVAAALDDHDALALPSRLEAFGTVALEALARERPAVVSAGCGIRDRAELAPGLHPIAEHEDLTAALRRLDGMAPAVLRHRTREARAAVSRLQAQTVADWLAVIAPGAGPCGP